MIKSKLISKATFYNKSGNKDIASFTEVASMNQTHSNVVLEIERSGVYDADAFRDKVLCTQQERDFYQELLNFGLHDSLDEFLDGPERFTWWDYRMNAFRRKLGLRIDHILLSNALYEQCHSVEILKSFRKMERPSDHAPVMATIH